MVPYINEPDSSIREYPSYNAPPNYNAGYMFGSKGSFGQNGICKNSM
jgi:hypothetical protein